MRPHTGSCPYHVVAHRQLPLLCNSSCTWAEADRRAFEIDAAVIESARERSKRTRASAHSEEQDKDTAAALPALCRAVAEEMLTHPDQPFTIKQGKSATNTASDEAKLFMNFAHLIKIQIEDHEDKDAIIR